MDKDLTGWGHRCMICGLLLFPLTAHQAGLPTSCKCAPQARVERQVTAPPEQPDSWPEVLQVLPEQVSAQTNWLSASSTVGYESLQKVSSGST